MPFYASIGGLLNKTEIAGFSESRDVTRQIQSESNTKQRYFCRSVVGQGGSGLKCREKLRFVSQCKGAIH